MERIIDVVIPVRDRDSDRIQKCVDHIRKSNLFNNIFVMDNSIKKPLGNIDGAEVIKLDYSGYWNKSWVINKGIKLCKSEYFMSIDCDILLSEEIINDIEKYIGENVLIINKNVRRIEPFLYSEDYIEMVSYSKTWFQSITNQIYNQAFGGIQVMSLEWIKGLNGYDENAGLLWGGMDNRIFEQAVLDCKCIIDLNLPMLHLEHPQKEKNLKEEEQEYGMVCRSLKRPYLHTKIERLELKNDSNWGGDIPNDEIMRKLTQIEIDKNRQEIKSEVEKAMLLKLNKFEYKGNTYQIECDETEDISSDNK